MARSSRGNAAVKFEPVPVVRRPAPEREVELHLAAFVRGFIGSRAGDRWEHCLFVAPEKASRHLQRFHQDLDPDYCRELTGSERFPARLAEAYGDQLGVYFDGGPEALLLTAPEAATLVSEGRNALWSLAPGKTVVCFDHEGGVWACKR